MNFARTSPKVAWSCLHSAAQPKTRLCVALLGRCLLVIDAFPTVLSAPEQSPSVHHTCETLSNGAMAGALVRASRPRSTRDLRRRVQNPSDKGGCVAGSQRMAPFPMAEASLSAPKGSLAHLGSAQKQFVAGNQQAPPPRFVSGSVSTSAALSPARWLS
ncbi:hypothetical protein BGZ61DRAFT_449318 [Ilyonectria robusta]|uniref:uncharacterized protein n=1 Tax=Ilyonectria robusta TaxID=1079257 RepID=UPI001E8E641E|nr:uncharacterized protein BGZ61DRAFT_449318 [Ilyonectria robusta]KAH8714606.1 hypothetical protein BGZ61DRAFT_449318 [Ilyonectria robusta]